MLYTYRNWSCCVTCILPFWVPTIDFNETLVEFGWPTRPTYSTAQLAEGIMVDLWRDFWLRETGTGHQVAQLHDRYMMLKMMMMMMTKLTHYVCYAYKCVLYVHTHRPKHVYLLSYILDNKPWKISQNYVHIQTKLKRKVFFKLWTQEKHEHSNINGEYVQNSVTGVYRYLFVSNWESKTTYTIILWQWNRYELNSNCFTSNF